MSNGKFLSEINWITFIEARFAAIPVGAEQRAGDETANHLVNAKELRKHKSIWIFYVTKIVLSNVWVTFILYKMNIYVKKTNLEDFDDAPVGAQVSGVQVGHCFCCCLVVKLL
jgi:hypothetical protein